MPGGSAASVARSRAAAAPACAAPPRPLAPCSRCPLLPPWCAAAKRDEDVVAFRRRAGRARAASSSRGGGKEGERKGSEGERRARAPFRRLEPTGARWTPAAQEERNGCRRHAHRPAHAPLPAPRANRRREHVFFSASVAWWEARRGGRRRGAARGGARGACMGSCIAKQRKKQRRHSRPGGHTRAHTARLEAPLRRPYELNKCIFGAATCRQGGAGCAGRAGRRARAREACLHLGLETTVLAAAHNRPLPRASAETNLSAYFNGDRPGRTAVPPVFCRVEAF